MARRIAAEPRRYRVGIEVQDIDQCTAMARDGEGSRIAAEQQRRSSQRRAPTRQLAEISVASTARRSGTSASVKAREDPVSITVSLALNDPKTNASGSETGQQLQPRRKA
jgi:hypothetical protein